MKEMKTLKFLGHSEPYEIVDGKIRQELLNLKSTLGTSIDDDTIEVIGQDHIKIGDFVYAIGSDLQNCLSSDEYSPPLVPGTTVSGTLHCTVSYDKQYVVLYNEKISKLYKILDTDLQYLHDIDLGDITGNESSCGFSCATGGSFSPSSNLFICIFNGRHICYGYIEDDHMKLAKLDGLNASVHKLKFMDNGNKLLTVTPYMIELYKINGFSLTKLHEFNMGDISLTSSTRAENKYSDILISSDGTVLILYCRDNNFIYYDTLFAINDDQISFIDKRTDPGITTISDDGKYIITSRYIDGGYKTSLYKYDNNVVTFLQNLYRDENDTLVSSLCQSMFLNENYFIINAIADGALSQLFLYRIIDDIVHLIDVVDDGGIVQNIRDKSLSCSDDKQYVFVRMNRNEMRIYKFNNNILSLVDSYASKSIVTTSIKISDKQNILADSSHVELLMLDDSMETISNVSVVRDKIRNTLDGSISQYNVSSDGSILIIGGYFTGKVKIYKIYGNYFKYLGTCPANENGEKFGDDIKTKSVGSISCSDNGRIIHFQLDGARYLYLLTSDDNIVLINKDTSAISNVPINISHKDEDGYYTILMNGAVYKINTDTNDIIHSNNRLLGAHNYIDSSFSPDVKFFSSGNYFYNNYDDGPSVLTGTIGTNSYYTMFDNWKYIVRYDRNNYTITISSVSYDNDNIKFTNIHSVENIVNEYGFQVLNKLNSVLFITNNTDDNLTYLNIYSHDKQCVVSTMECRDTDGVKISKLNKIYMLSHNLFLLSVRMENATQSYHHKLLLYRINSDYSITQIDACGGIESSSMNLYSNGGGVTILNQTDDCWIIKADGVISSIIREYMIMVTPNGFSNLIKITDGDCMIIPENCKIVIYDQKDGSKMYEYYFDMTKRMIYVEPIAFSASFGDDALGFGKNGYYLGISRSNMSPGDTGNIKLLSYYKNPLPPSINEDELTRMLDEVFI